MPAKKNPVRKRRVKRLAKSLPSQITARLNSAPSKALIKNTREGAKRSAMVRIAKRSVPMINPNCTAEVRCPKALSAKPKFLTRSLITPFPANQSEVQQNCEITMMGRIYFGSFIFLVGE
jgi:hypothetical protein